tara:strand:+ start:116 stop:229 length:114 start_codon:yes stop_codon:yes gene_type:complete
MNDLFNNKLTPIIVEKLQGKDLSKFLISYYIHQRRVI